MNNECFIFKYNVSISRVNIPENQIQFFLATKNPEWKPIESKENAEQLTEELKIGGNILLHQLTILNRTNPHKVIEISPIIKEECYVEMSIIIEFSDPEWEIIEFPGLDWFEKWDTTDVFHKSFVHELTDDFIGEN